MALLTNEQRVLAAALNGEAAIWTGRPLPGFRLRSGDYGQIAMGVFVLLFFTFWETMALKGSGGDPMFALFGAVVFCIAFYQTFGQAIWTVAARGRTYYALTQNGFAVIYIDAFGGRTKRIYLPALNNMDLEISADGSGCIVFGSVETPPWWARNRSWPVRLPAFEFIPDASNVYDICARLQSGKA